MIRKQFNLDKERAALVLKRLEDAYNNKEKIFSQKDLYPQEKLLKYFNKDSLDFRLLLFLLVCFDHNINSRVFYEKAAQAVESTWLAEPKKVLDFDYLTLDSFMGMLGLPFEHYTNDLRVNTGRLKWHYGSDPLNILKGVNDVTKAVEKFQEFKQYGPFTAAQLITYYLKYRIIDFPNKQDLIPKIDINKLRVLYETGIIKPDKDSLDGRIHKDNIIPPTAEFVRDVCKNNNISIVNISEVLWVHGSRITSIFRENGAKRYRNYFLNSPIFDLCDSSKFIESFYVKKSKNRKHFKGGYLYFTKLDFKQGFFRFND